MLGKKRSYYHIEDNSKTRRSNKGRLVALLSGFVLLGVGGYLLFLLNAPAILTPQASASSEEALLESNENFIKIDHIGILVPFYTGNNEATLERGAWYRFPERGSPEAGGNFILSAHRFKIGATPSETVKQSPFYYLDKVEKNDAIDIYYNGKWYKYLVTDIKSVKPDAVEIEEPSEEAKLTLYSCTLKGSADGRIVIEAKPVAQPTDQSSSQGSAVLF